MRLKLALLTTALAFGLGTTAALAEDAPGAKSDITIVENNPSGANVPGTNAEGKGDAENPGALSAPEKDDQGNAPSSGGAMNEPSDNSGALTAPEKSGAAEPEQVPGSSVPGKGAAATQDDESNDDKM
jgi:hypothetical protein